MIIEEPSQGEFRISLQNTSIPRQFRIEGATSKYDAYLTLVKNGINIGVPYKDTHSGETPDPLLLATDISIKPEGERELTGGVGAYVAVVIYSKNIASTPHGIMLEPDGPAVFYSEMSLNQEDCDIDTSGNAILNTAGVPFDNPIQKLVPEEFLIAEWISGNWTFADAVAFSREYWGKLNSDTWMGAAPGCVLCMGLSPRALDMNCFVNGGYIKFSAKFGYKPKQTLNWRLMPVQDPDNPEASDKTEIAGYIARRLNSGTSIINEDYEIGDPVKEMYKPIMVGDKDDDNRTKATSPMLLNLEGTALLAEEDDPIVLGWETIEYTAFSGLGIA